MSSGQNCAGCERVLIQASVFDACLSKLVAGARSLRQRAPLEGDPTAVDVGALALPGLAQTIASLVDDAVSDGAKVRLTAVHLPVLTLGEVVARYECANLRNSRWILRL